MHNIIMITEVHIIPSDVFVSTPGGSASVSCFSTHEIVDIEWLVNGTRFDNNLGPNVMSQFSSSVRTGRLDFVNLPLNYNGTSVQCIAELDSGELTSSSIILLIQGLIIVHVYHAVKCISMLIIMCITRRVL